MREKLSYQIINTELSIKQSFVISRSLQHCNIGKNIGAGSNKQRKDALF